MRSRSPDSAGSIFELREREREGERERGRDRETERERERERGREGERKRGREGERERGRGQRAAREAVYKPLNATKADDKKPAKKWRAGRIS